MEVTKLQQLLCVLTTNVAVRINTTDSFLDGLLITLPPTTSHLDGFVRVVNAEQDSVGSDFVDNILESGGRKVTTSGEPDVLLEVVIDGLLAEGGALLLLGDRPLDCWLCVVGCG